jgi:hypothetical protein
MDEPALASDRLHSFRASALGLYLVSERVPSPLLQSTRQAHVKRATDRSRQERKEPLEREPTSAIATLSHVRSRASL